VILLSQKLLRIGEKRTATKYKMFREWKLRVRREFFLWYTTCKLYAKRVRACSSRALRAWRGIAHVQSYRRGGYTGAGNTLSYHRDSHSHVTNSDGDKYTEKSVIARAVAVSVAVSQLTYRARVRIAAHALCIWQDTVKSARFRVWVGRAFWCRMHRCAYEYLIYACILAICV
jgi:hypothetical protein